jgi:hypothetical protein
MESMSPEKGWTRAVVIVMIAAKKKFEKKTPDHPKVAEGRSRV